jgi:hypothetical protein
VGLCRKLQHYTFQLEGDDCELFEFGTAREVLEPAEIPAPKARHDMSLNQILIEQNANRIMRWHAEGRSRWWMAQTIGMPVNNSNAIARWLKAQGAL